MHAVETIEQIHTFTRVLLSVINVNNLFDILLSVRVMTGIFEICKFSLSERLKMAICIFLQNFVSLC